MGQSEVANITESIMSCFKNKREKSKPYLDKLIPSSRYNDGVFGIHGESNTGDPLRVSVIGDGYFAVPENIPELDGAISGAADNLAVVWRKGNRQHVIRVADEASRGLASGQFPQSQRLVPGGRHGVLSITRNGAVLDEVVVAL